MEKETLRLTPEQVQTIERLRTMWPHTTSIDLRNETPNGLRVTINFSLAYKREYSLDSTGDYFLLKN